MTSPYALPRAFGRYLLVDRLSRGGMGEIFLARHGLSGFEKLVVVKKVLPRLASDKAFIRRFIDEAKLAVNLQHANIAQVFEVGQVESEYFLAIEHIDGRDLRRTLAVLRERRQRLPADIALYIAREIAAGLAYAHRRTDAHGRSLGLVHCDISPPNVMLSFEGEVKIIDFGIAKSALKVEPEQAFAFGKLGYMAPEQLVKGGRIDFATDIYAVGAVLYELLTACPLYEIGEDPDVKALARKVCRGNHPLPSEKFADLKPFDALVKRALEPEAKDRFESAGALRDAIQTALVGINPVLSPDRVGKLLRELFAGEIDGQQERLFALGGTDLEPWAEMLTAPAGTISFARAEQSLGHDEVTLKRSRRRPKRWVLAAVLVLLAGAGLVFGRSFWPGKEDAGTTAGAEAALLVESLPLPSTSPAAEARNPAPASTPPVAESRNPAPAAEPPTPEEARETGAPEPTTPAARAEKKRTEEPSSRRRRRSDRARSRRRADKATARTAQKQEPPEPALSAAEVQAKFRALIGDYKRFRARYGGRLEARWTDLVTYAQYAKGPDKRERLVKKMAAFRAEMRAIASPP